MVLYLGVVDFLCGLGYATRRFLYRPSIGSLILCSYSIDIMVDNKGESSQYTGGIGINQGKLGRLLSSEALFLASQQKQSLLPRRGALMVNVRIGCGAPVV